MHWLAIGILSLLALSTMISSKRFRVFIGTVSVVVIAAVAVLSFMKLREPSARDAQVHWRPLLTWIFQMTKQPDFRQTAADTSAQVFADMEKTKFAESGPRGDDLAKPLIDSPHPATGSAEVSPNTETKPTFIFVRPIKLEPSKVSSNVDEEVTLHERMASVIGEYLKTHHNPSLDPGVDQLQPEDLNWRLLRFLNKGSDEYGVKQVTVVFDDTFHKHVRERGRQWVTKDHLKKAGAASGGTLAMLTIVFGLLKLRQSKREVAPASDLLASSGVWMV